MGRGRRAGMGGEEALLNLRRSTRRRGGSGRGRRGGGGGERRRKGSKEVTAGAVFPKAEAGLWKMSRHLERCDCVILRFGNNWVSHFLFSKGRR